VSRCLGSTAQDQRIFTDLRYLPQPGEHRKSDAMADRIGFQQGLSKRHELVEVVV
jgi:hypothetical protein